MELTLEQAKQIREWRVVKGCTWRRVADNFSEYWPEVGIDPGNQIEGIGLCYVAMTMLSETYEDGWN